MNLNTKDEYFQQAISIVMNPNTDYTQIVGLLAQRYPEILCELAGVKPWQIEVRRIYYSDGLVAAIKYVRTHFGPDQVGIADGKKMVEELVK